MKISPTHKPSPHYPALATLAVAAAFATPACQQQPQAGVLLPQVSEGGVIRLPDFENSVESGLVPGSMFIPPPAEQSASKATPPTRREPQRLPGKVVPRR